MKTDVSKVPNLFNYATSELSQDAVLCWMLDWINYEESDMKSFAFEFVDRILKLYNYINLNARDIRQICVKRQYRNIDILLKIYFKTNDVLYLIIEDKMNSVEHSEQLKRYREIITDLINNEENSIGVIGIYYKSGFIFDHEKENVELNSYKVFDKAMMIKLMDEHKNDIANDIFVDYYKYLKLLKLREDNLDYIIENNISDKMYEIFNSFEGQWILASKMIKKMNKKNIKAFYNGTNRGGSPWTQIAINMGFENHSLPDGIFYRLDSRNEGHYLALRQYLDYEDSKNCKKYLGTTDSIKILENKQERLERLRACFTKVTNILKNKDYYMPPGRTSNRGKKECEIGVFFINKENDFMKILKFVPEFNELFCLELKNVFGVELNE